MLAEGGLVGRTSDRSKRELARRWAWAQRARSLVVGRVRQDGAGLHRGNKWSKFIDFPAFETGNLSLVAAVPGSVVHPYRHMQPTDSS